MCGIAGIWGRPDVPRLEEMAEVLRHRGPDQHGRFLGPHGTLDHRRLAVVDPPGGRQPLYNEDGALAAVVNGEIYNSGELKRDLTGRHRFGSRSDSEVIIHLYEDFGPDAASELEGMFAVAVADGAHLFAARDPIGIKPLYYADLGDRFIIASEMKALRRWPRAIREFPPGTWYRSDIGFRRYHRPCRPDTDRMSIEAWRRKLRRRLEESVARRLMSDVPVGTFLSGGLDSSLITALLREHVEELHTVAVGFANSPDLDAARRVARHLGTVHHEYLLSRDEVTEKLPEIIYHLESFDVDLVRSAIPCYFAARTAAEHVKVVLTGEGADELLAGYEYHRAYQHPQALEDELTASVYALHNMNLQRVDRMTMAHSIEARVPFLDLAVIDLAGRIPSALKLRGTPPTEKWILRAASEDLLPREIVWRPKAQFDEGSGSTALLRAAAPTLAANLGAEVGSKSGSRECEAAVYRTLYRSCFGAATEGLVAKWRGSTQAA
jgi:asparagine synthase (glutamine-hydrolysing)